MAAEAARRALENAGHGKMEPLVYFMPQGNASLTLKVEQVMEEFVLPEQLDAVIAPNDLVASHLMRSLQQRGIRIPAEVAVAGFDNDSFSESLYPSLTTIDDNNDLIGKYAVDLLLEQVEQGRTPGKGARTAHVTPCIIRRESI